MYLIIEINHLIELIDRSKRIEESIEEKNRISQKKCLQSSSEIQREIGCSFKQGGGSRERMRRNEAVNPIKKWE